MKGYAKIRLAVFLCIMLVLPSIVSVLPMTAQEASAAEDVTLSWTYEIYQLGTTPIEIEKGAKFYVGDYTNIYEGDTYTNASLTSKAVYTSSKKSVATVSSKGLLTAKKTGTTTIKIKYKGKTISAKFKVVKKGSLTTSTEAKRVQTAADKIKTQPAKITKSNALKQTKLKNNYSNSVSKYSSVISESGFLKEQVTSGNYTYYTTSAKLAVPDAGRYKTLSLKLYSYSDTNSPTSTRGSKSMKISSVSANTKQITVKLKKAIDVEQILAANIQYCYYNEKPTKKSAVIYLSIYDKTADESYIGFATITKGSKILKIQCMSYVYTDGIGSYVAQKLVKGHTYRIGAKDVSWGNGKTVKVK